MSAEHGEETVISQLLGPHSIHRPTRANCPHLGTNLPFARVKLKNKIKNINK